MRLEFFFDVISPNSYLAWTQLPALVDRTGAELIYRPFFLGAVMKATGNQPPGAIAPKGRWMLADMKRYAAAYGVPLEMNPHFPMMNTLPIQRAAHARRESPDFETFLGAMFRAVWKDQRNVGDREDLTEALHAAGIDPAEFWSDAEDAENRAALQATTEEAIERGAFGAPTFFLGNELHFGQDRFHFIEAALRA